eukprot:CAMPEP_0170187418 /NCGR_PEP_ID=MMETSP0040_2-20121228/41674_1 /TAXON_ID=641309 /ORGANISM="Lotharella oceanica, Strain CCMP622" /LENGTH=98 /DNA_ID=CAMNT_0010434445 /DNA_START=261 /DNA_END=557 /DNA_ORIENTATION=+
MTGDMFCEEKCAPRGRKLLKEGERVSHGFSREGGESRKRRADEVIGNMGVKGREHSGGTFQKRNASSLSAIGTGTSHGKIERKRDSAAVENGKRQPRL